MTCAFVARERPEVSTIHRPDAADFHHWLRRLEAASRLSPKATAVVDAIATDPQRASYASVRDVAAAARVNLATVTRTAQSLGFSGWPMFQHEVRARYLADLTATAVAQSRSNAGGHPGEAALERDRANLDYFIGAVDRDLLAATARDIAAARRTVVVGSGSYAFVAQALAFNGTTAGYDLRSFSDPAPLSHALAATTCGDLIIGISFWRFYNSTLHALHSASEKGARVVLITDAPTPKAEQVSDRIVAVPTDGGSFFPSLTVAMSLIQAIVTELTALAPERTQASIARSEAEWQRLDLLYR
ncbi:MAG: MurR/RpiR family transcriptional regulator [Comamonadaceae bacterium]|jgi:DNA-binding MurR/RpiR family transcriptional regulator|nr:MAG: MurR/RpiR family transcriptional regulator [Comamonadaceae bacterium]